MSAYFTADDVSNEVFDGEAVPGPDTVTKPRHERFTEKCTNLLHGLFNLTELHDDSFGLLKEFGLLLYKRLLDDDKAPPIRPEDSIMIKLITRRYKLVPLYILNQSEEA